MGNSLRCCLACVLPCGALDVVRVVHLSGHVDEYSRHVYAGEVMAAHPHHVLSKACTQGVGVRRIVIVSPDSELKRGGIYFLVPSSTLPPEHRRLQKKRSHKRKRHTAAAAATTKNDASAMAAAPLMRSPLNSVDDDSYSTQIPASKRSHHHRRRSAARVGVWRPHLESICEDS